MYHAQSGCRHTLKDTWLQGGDQWITAVNRCSLLTNVSNQKMVPAGVLIVISLLKATGGKSRQSCQQEVRVSERKRDRNWLQAGVGEGGVLDRQRQWKSATIYRSTRTQRQACQWNWPRGIMGHWIYSHPSVSMVILAALLWCEWKRTPWPLKYKRVCLN